MSVLEVLTLIAGLTRQANALMEFARAAQEAERDLTPAEVEAVKALLDQADDDWTTALDRLRVAGS